MKIEKIMIIISLLVVFRLELGYSEELKVKLEYCHDGDSCTATTPQGERIKVRLHSIDAPELKQTGGYASRNYLESLIKGKKVSLDCNGRSYNRLTCHIQLDGRDIESEMVQAGWAWDYAEFSKGRYKPEMQKAQQMGAGLWASNNIRSPYCFRWPEKAACIGDVKYQP